MPAYASPTSKSSGDVAGTLRLLAYLALSIGLIVFDHRGGWLSQLRAQANVAVQPLWWLAGLPARLGDSMRDDAVTRTRLTEENRRLRNQILLANARQARLQTAAAENERLRGLLGAAQRGRLDVQLAPILDIDLDPTRQRLILDAGGRDGVHLGQSVIDAGGLVGQIIEVTPFKATVLLITDPDHAVPVTVARSGVRLIAYGKGRSDLLELTNIPVSSDVQVGDAIVTSGIGGRFPPGFPVGTVKSLRPDDSRAFLVGELKPAAQLDRGRDVLLLRNLFDAAPDVAANASTAAAATAATPAATTAATAPAAVPGSRSTASNGAPDTPPPTSDAALSATRVQLPASAPAGTDPVPPASTDAPADAEPDEDALPIEVPTR